MRSRYIAEIASLFSKLQRLVGVGHVLSGLLYSMVERWVPRCDV
jgi:hypothetical protein